jgi:hypothetical protein
MDIARFQQLIQEAELEQLMAADSVLHRAPTGSKGNSTSIVIGDGYDVLGCLFGRTTGYSCSKTSP